MDDDDQEQRQWQYQHQEQRRHDSFLLTLVRQPVLVGAFGVAYLVVYGAPPNHDEWPRRQQEVGHSTVSSSASNFVGDRAGVLMGLTSTSTATTSGSGFAKWMGNYYGPKV